MEIVIIGGIGDIFKNLLDGYEDNDIKVKFVKKERAKTFFEVETLLSEEETTNRVKKVVKEYPNSKALSYMFESDLGMYYELAEAAKKIENSIMKYDSILLYVIFFIY